jgi:hypothetical protein
MCDQRPRDVAHGTGKVRVVLACAAAHMTKSAHDKEGQWATSAAVHRLAGARTQGSEDSMHSVRHLATGYRVTQLPSMPMLHHGPPMSTTHRAMPASQLAEAYHTACRGRQARSSTAKVEMVLRQPQKPCSSPYAAAQPRAVNAPRVPTPGARPTRWRTKAAHTMAVARRLAASVPSGSRRRLERGCALSRERYQRRIVPGGASTREKVTCRQGAYRAHSSAAPTHRARPRARQLRSSHGVVAEWPAGLAWPAAGGPGLPFGDS